MEKLAVEETIKRYLPTLIAIQIFSGN